MYLLSRNSAIVLDSTENQRGSHDRGIPPSPIAKAFLENHIHAICDKLVAVTSAEPRELQKIVGRKGLFTSPRPLSRNPKKKDSFQNRFLVV